MDPKQASGNIRSDGGSSFTGSFVVNGSEKPITVKFDDSFPPFASGNATLTFNNFLELLGTHRCEGTFGSDGLELKREDGTTIKAKSEYAIPIPETINLGHGEWTWD